MKTHSYRYELSKQEKSKDTHAQTHQSEIDENRRQTKNVESSQRKMMPNLLMSNILMTVDFSLETIKAEGSGKMFLKKKNCKPRILYPEKYPSEIKVK